MKKVKFIPMGLMLPLITNLCIGQTRKCDLEVTISSPTKGAVFAYGDRITLSAIFKNNGPDDMMTGDTILCATPQTQSGQATAMILQKAFAKGESFETVFMETTNGNSNSEDQQGNLCIEIYNPVDVLPSSSWGDPSLDNNRGCTSVTLKAKGSSNSINLVENAKIKLSCYPNPANDKINISLESLKGTVSSVRLMDISGREIVRKEVKELNPTADKQIILDVAAIIAGTYFVEVQSDREKAITKVVIED